MYNLNYIRLWCITNHFFYFCGKIYNLQNHFIRNISYKMIYKKYFLNNLLEILTIIELAPCNNSRFLYDGFHFWLDGNHRFWLCGYRLGRRRRRTLGFLFAFSSAFAFLFAFFISLIHLIPISFPS